MGELQAIDTIVDLQALPDPQEGDTYFVLETMTRWEYTLGDWDNTSEMDPGLT